MDTRQALEAIRAAASTGSLAELCQSHHVELLVLFGSAVTNPSPRDIDLALAFEADAPRDLLATIDALGRTFRTDHLDIMDLDRAGPVARQRALTKGEILFTATPKAFSERQLRAMVEFMDTAWLRELQREVLARG